MSAPETLPGRLLELAAAAPTRVAFRRKHLGVWEETTFAEYARRVAAVGLGLRALGVRPGDRVAIQADNRPEWLLADLAVQGIGAISVGVYPTSPSAGLRHVLTDADVSVLLADDEEQLDKALAVRGDVPALRDIVVVDVPKDAEASVRTFAELEALGADRPAGEFAEAVAALDPDACAIVVYTSGTTGPPKGAMLTHANLAAASAAFGAVNGENPDDEALSYLPLCHIAERMLSVVNAVRAGYAVNFGEGGSSFAADLREVQPTIFLGVPRVWEKVLAGVDVKMSDATRAKRAVYRFWLAQGRHCAGRRMAGRLTPLDRVVLGVGWLLLYRSVHAKLGLSRVRIALSGAAPIAPQILEWLWAIGIPVRELYGQTENTALATCTAWGAVRIGSVGQAYPGVELRIADDGEVLTRSAGTFLGYFRNDAATREAIHDDGWLHTGDIGHLDPDGFLTITERKKDLIVTAGGKNIAPSEIENRLKVSPFVREAIVIGDRRPFVTALIGVEPDTVADWAGRRGIPFTTYHDLTERPEVIELVREVVDSVNADLAAVETIKRFRLLPAELDEESGELTATRKVKRATVAERYAGLIAEMYQDAVVSP